MAKFHSYYVLCPLIDQNSFLGVNVDRENENVLVTLGRNVVNKYRLSDQKQIGGWTSKDHITSAVIYDTEQESYIGVFNKNTIKAWKDEGENLDKLKKYKFTANILKVIPRHNQTSLIIFENGNCASLPYGIENRKTYESKLFIKESETIIEVGSYNSDKQEYICFILKSKSTKRERYEILTCAVRDELGDLEKANVIREKVSRTDNVFVVGQLVKNDLVFFLWNDSKLSVYNLITKSWKKMVTVPWISTSSCVSLAWMGENHLILFGSNTDEDGAILVAFNVILGVGSCKYPMKMYTKDAKLYCFNKRIILQGSNHIAMVPYVVETDRNLSSLLGSHDIIPDNVTEIADWGTPTVPLFPVGNVIKDLWTKGLTERNLCAQIIPLLIEKNDLKGILEVLNEFKDIPESVIVSLLSYAIKIINPNSIDVTDEDAVQNLCFSEENKEKIELLKYLLQISFSDAIIIPHLRNSFTLSGALFLISFIVHVINDLEIHIVYESKLYDWCILLMDTFYQQYLITKDNKVTYVLDKLQKLTVSLIDNLNTINKAMPVVDKLIHGNQVPEEKALSSYTIELINI
ncbi:unnamed protein product [Leptosia nina]|uniref:Nucleolar protein 11 n=1 Tax=Leptosia nina TaxID=320188 RepID=A0AAV1J622_9NEOP